VTLQGKAIWALGFFSFLSILNTITAIVLAINLGIENTFNPYLIDSLTGGIPVYVYLSASIIAALAFLGATSIKLVTELSNKALLNEINARVTTVESGQKLQQKFLESLQARVFLVDESVNSMRKEVAKAFGEQGEEIKQVQAKLVDKFDSELVDLKREMAKQIGKQTEEIKKLETNLAKMVTKNLDDTKDELASQIVGLGNIMARHERNNKKSEKAILQQGEEIANVKLELERLEEELGSPKPQLTSDCEPEDVRGIGENTGKELRAMGIKNVGELVLTDPAVIAEGTDMSEKTVEKLQGRAQLAMVSGIKEKDLILLEEVEVMNRKELAEQDPMELGKKINSVFALCVEKGKLSETEKPTIEEIYSWVKFARG
jgi:nucleotidyltransferase/DNA polymerase involved in DNA repair